MTYAYSTCDRRTDEDVRKFTANLENGLAYCFRSIFILAGERNSSAFIGGIESYVKESEIVKSALDLSEMIKTKFFSAYLDVYTVDPGAEFREEYMEIEINSASEALRARYVQCTLEIGICTIHPQGGRGRILLKPKVSLMVSGAAFRVFPRSYGSWFSLDRIYCTKSFQRNLIAKCF